MFLLHLWTHNSSALDISMILQCWFPLLICLYFGEHQTSAHYFILVNFVTLIYSSFYALPWIIIYEPVWAFSHHLLTCSLTVVLIHLSQQCVGNSIISFLSQALNPFTPKISIVILLTLFHTILMMSVQWIWHWVK